MHWTYLTTWTLLYPWKHGVPPTNGQLGGTTHPISLHTSTQSIPWPPSCSLTTSTSILDPLWAMLTWYLQGWPASTCLRPNDLETFRHAQGCPDSPSYIQPPQVHPDHLQTTHRSPTAVQELLECLETETRKLQRFWCQPGHPVHRAGATSWLTPTPQYVVHVCYLTTHKAPPEMPVGLPSSRSGGQSRWYTSGAEKLQVEPD